MTHYNIRNSKFKNDMANRVTTLFQSGKRNILSVYYTAGFPSVDNTVPVAKHLADAGADIIEIGIPFSDPVADGPTIQESNKVALQGGMDLHRLVDQVKAIRNAGVDIPIILMGYLNPVMQYGMGEFVRDAVKAGVDGLILPDLPIYEYEQEYRELFEKSNLCNTFLISPTTSEERIRSIDAATRGFIYAVSASSVTGAKGKFTAEQLQYFGRLRGMQLRNPFLIGFGISTHAAFATACEHAAGAIVGSAFVNLLAKTRDLEKDIHAFVKELKG